MLHRCDELVVWRSMLKLLGKPLLRCASCARIADHPLSDVRTPPDRVIRYAKREDHCRFAPQKDDPRRAPATSQAARRLERHAPGGVTPVDRPSHLAPRVWVGRASTWDGPVLSGTLSRVATSRAVPRLNSLSSVQKKSMGRQRATGTRRITSSMRSGGVSRSS